MKHSPEHVHCTMFGLLELQSLSNNLPNVLIVLKFGIHTGRTITLISSHSTSSPDEWYVIERINLNLVSHKSSPLLVSLILHHVFPANRSRAVWFMMLIICSVTAEHSLKAVSFKPLETLCLVSRLYIDHPPVLNSRDINAAMVCLQILLFSYWISCTAEKAFFFSGRLVFFHVNIIIPLTYLFRYTDFCGSISRSHVIVS